VGYKAALPFYFFGFEIPGASIAAPFRLRSGERGRAAFAPGFANLCFLTLHSALVHFSAPALAVYAGRT
jgi:hypothetical protein